MNMFGIFLGIIKLEGHCTGNLDFSLYTLTRRNSRMDSEYYCLHLFASTKTWIGQDDNQDNLATVSRQAPVSSHRTERKAILIPGR